jgi:hypothetical protein
MYETPILSCQASGGGTEVEPLPRHPKGKGLRPVIAASTGREKWHKTVLRCHRCPIFRDELHLNIDL